MRIQRKKSPKKALVIAGVIVLIVGGGVYTYYATRTSDNKPSLETTNSDNSKTNDEDADKTDDETTQVDSGENEKDIPKQYEDSNTNTDGSLTGVINYKSVIDGNLTLRVTIDQSLTSGTCSLKLTSAGKTVTRSAPVVTNPSSSTCEGFSVPVSELSSGQWAIEITVTSGSRTGTLKDKVTI